MSGGGYSDRAGGYSDYDTVPTRSGGDIMQEYNTNLDLPTSVEQAHFT